MKNRIVVVDYGMGNLRSVAQALRAVAPAADVVISGEASAIDSADRVVLPGQGAMRDCMASLRASGVEAALRRAAATRPVLGVCVGEQMLFEHSEEGDTPGLGLLAGRVVRFRLEGRTGADGARLKVPQMGWNRVRQARAHPLWQGIPDNAWFYFVHSYYAVPADPQDTIGETEYGEVFCCAVAKDNIVATQFHPEKSAGAGLALYNNFVNWKP